jgi:hypothetical protein
MSIVVNRGKQASILDAATILMKKDSNLPSRTDSQKPSLRVCLSCVFKDDQEFVGKDVRDREASMYESSEKWK